MLWVVDDSPLEGEVVRAALAAKFDIEVFTSGAVALERLGSGERPDVLVLDWHMPDVSGLEVCRSIRGTYDAAQLPIVIVTAARAHDVLLEALEAGANDFIQKPIAKLELMARVGGLVRLKHLRGRLEETERKLRLEAVFRERFMAVLAHDLRQPLSTVLMGFHALSPLQLPDWAVSITARQLRAAKRMQRMIGDLLDSTRHRPESGMPIERQSTDFAKVAEKTLDEIRAAHPGRAIELAVGGPCIGHWDPDRLAQVLSNLVGNALTHGETNCQVDVRLTGTDGAVELCVINRGQAIPGELLEDLAHPFERARGVKRSSEGLGLGLHIVQHIVRAHGGSCPQTTRGGQYACSCGCRGLVARALFRAEEAISSRELATGLIKLSIGCRQLGMTG